MKNDNRAVISGIPHEFSRLLAQASANRHALVDITNNHVGKYAERCVEVSIC